MASKCLSSVDDIANEDINKVYRSQSVQKNEQKWAFKLEKAVFYSYILVISGLATTGAIFDACTLEFKVDGAKISMARSDFQALGIEQKSYSRYSN